jgi:hypothetical protein
MIKLKIVLSRISVYLLISGSLFAQNITFEPQDTFISDTLGTEIIFTIDITNVSQNDQTVFIVRTINDLPVNWSSALCIDVCFASSVDSVATTLTYGSTPLRPGETREVSLHISTMISNGTANVQLQAGAFDNPDNRIIVDFTATTLPTSVDEEGGYPSDYFLLQNYPNPFNPSTKIKFGTREAGIVNIKVYNILGVEIASLVNEYKAAGIYEVGFSNTNLSSGVYIYSLTVNNFSETRKMILEK